ncbi:MAG: tRNA pseudouridine(38-40) synthase TruA [Bryobacteraceae bacterium]
MPEERRIRATVAYDGTGFHGWQIQPGLPTIQGKLEEVVSGIEGTAVQVAGSGRTDAGVHAMGQVAAFTLLNPIPLYNLRKAVNRLLPPSIRILDLLEAHPGFHPRFEAVAKTYEYRIFRGETCHPLDWRYTHHFPFPLDEPAIDRLALVLEGDHDFSAFAATDPSDRKGQARVRTVFSSRIERSPDRLVYRVRGSGFLKHMVRNIVGALLEGGKGNLNEGDLRNLLAAGRRTHSAPTAPAKGLFLMQVEYSESNRTQPCVGSPN